MSAPILEPRSADELAAALHARIPAFLPGWQATPGGPGNGLFTIYGHFLRTLAERIDAAPDKNELAFLDLLGLDVLPAGAARAPVIFATFPGGGNGRAPARTRLGAKGPDPARPLVFETERAVGLAEAQLAEVVTLWPGNDAYADHSAEAIGGRPFTLWEGLQPVPHELYLAHDLHFALSGEASVALDVTLAPGGSAPLKLEWSWWDGKAWRAFKEFRPTDQPGWSLDGTIGLTRSGTIRLVTDCAASEQRVIGGWTAHWLRARLAKSLPPDSTRLVPQVDRIGILTSLSQVVSGACSGGLLPDTAFADGQNLDFTKPCQPLGARPGPGSALYLACADPFTRPGATVTVCVRKASTSEDEADAKSHQYELDVTKAQKLLEAAREAARLTKGALDALAATDLRIDDLPDLWDSGQPDQWYDSLTAEIKEARRLVLDAIPHIGGAIVPPPFGGLGNAVTVLTDLIDAATHLTKVPNNHAAKAANLHDIASSLVDELTAPPPLDPGLLVAKAIRVADLSGKLPTAATDLTEAISLEEIFLPAMKPAIFADAQAHFDKVKSRVTSARTELETALTQIKIVIDNLALLSPMSAAAASGFLPPTLEAPKLAWEYWNGSAWHSLPVDPAGDAANFRGDGEFKFTVPDDWASSAVNGVDGLWARARLKSGSYAKLRLVSWKDQETEAVNFLPIIEPRPPVLDAFRIGYEWTPKPAVVPERCLTLNDFRWRDHTQDAAWHGGAFTPFRSVEDVTPALYLGFDRPLPADELGFLFDVELAAVEKGPALDWEHWDGATWRRLTVEDETDALAVPGIVSVLWPGGPIHEPATVVAGSDQEVRLVDARAAACFTGGDLVWIESDGKGELATVAGVNDDVVETAAPLSAAYRQATIVRAELPRFGHPRTWLRARLRSDGEPLHARVRGIYPNAGWAAEVETVEDELLGGGNGEPRQVFFLTRTPVLSDEQIEVRELEGARAHVEYPLLVDELRARGIREVELRVIRDPQTDHVREVWVPWRRRTTLAFSGPSDRDYTLERTRGKVLFGDGVYGLVPPAGVDNVRARRYRSGGGPAGNVHATTITQVLSGALVSGVSNPVRAEGGAATEPDAAVLARGPLSVRHRRQALTLADFEALACEASPGVAVARASARRGRVAVTIVPYSPDPVPEPSWELRREVRDFLRLRAPASLGGAISVVAPVYILVGAAAVVAPRAPAVAGSLVAAATAALHRFFHPITGGPDGVGWPFGRDVHLSDVAALLEQLEDLDVVEELVLVVNGAPQPENVVVPADRLVAAGTIDIELGAVS